MADFTSRTGTFTAGETVNAYTGIGLPAAASAVAAADGSVTFTGTLADNTSYTLVGQTSGITRRIFTGIPDTGGGLDFSVVDAKGDLIVGSANDLVDNLGVGTDGQALVADSTQPLGVKWGTIGGTGISPTVVDVKGDLIAASGADVVARLAAGANDTVLIADSAQATGLKYAKVADAQVSATAAIGVSKLAAGASAQVLLNSATPTPTWTTVTGDVTISSTGVTAIASGVIVDGDIAGSGITTRSKLPAALAYEDEANVYSVGPQTINANSTNQALLLTGGGAWSASTSTGGLLNVDATGGTGAGLIVYSNRGADAAGRLLHVFQDNAANPQSAFRVLNDGTGISVQMVGTNTAGNEVLDVLSSSTTTTTMGVQGEVKGQSLVKLTHSRTSGTANDDANAAILRLNWDNADGLATAVQGLFMATEPGGPATTGDLVKIWNGPSSGGTATTKLWLDPNGKLALNTTGNTGGLVVGDVQLYRNGAGVLQVKETTSAIGTTVNIASGATGQGATLGFIEGATTKWQLTHSGSSHDLVLLDVPGGSTGFRQPIHFYNTGNVLINATDGGGPYGLAGVRSVNTNAIFNVDNVGATSTPTTRGINVTYNLSSYSGAEPTAIGGVFVQNIVGPNVDLTSGNAFAGGRIGGIAARFISYLQNPGQTTGATVLSLASHAQADQASIVDNEVSSALFSSVDNTATGTVHPRMWGLDLGVHGYAGNERTQGMVGASLFMNNYYDRSTLNSAGGSPVMGQAAPLQITTLKGNGPGATANHMAADTYPLDAGITIIGRSTVGASTYGYGFIYGIDLGGTGNLWYGNTANVTRFQYGQRIRDWGQVGLRIGARYSGAAESSPFALQIDNDGMNVKGSNTIDHSTANTESTNFLALTAPGTGTITQTLLSFGSGQSITYGSGGASTTSLRAIEISPSISVAGNITGNPTLRGVNFGAVFTLTDSSTSRVATNIHGYRMAAAINFPASGTQSHGSVVSTEWLSFTDSVGYGASTGTDTGTIAAHSSFRSAIAVGTGWTLTTYRGVRILSPTGGDTITTLLGIDIEDLGAYDAGAGTNAAANCISLRSLGTVPHMEHAGAVKIGATGGPAAGLALDVTGVVGVQAGASTATSKVGGVIFSYNTDAGNTTTTETDLYTDSIAASTLGTNKDKLEARYAGVTVNSATATRQFKVYFGGTAIFDSSALTLAFTGNWDIDVLIVRVSATVVRYSVRLTIDSSTVGTAGTVYMAAGELTGLTLSNANTLKITGQAAGAGAATNDIVAKCGSVKWMPSP